jgi:hypothetical protein
MKPFLPFLLVPVLGLGGWLVAAYLPASEPAVMPNILTLDAPPALGVALPAPPGDGPVHVSIAALLPPVSQAVLAQVAAEEPLPEVSAILVIGRQRLAQIQGSPMVIGEQLGQFRVADIEVDRVLFEQTGLGNQRWVTVNDR